jgi:hypothetical protein
MPGPEARKAGPQAVSGARLWLAQDVTIGLGLALFSLALYAATLFRSIGPEDSGELAAAAHTLGVTHPTGYPLFSLLGRVFSLLPLGDLRVIGRLNFMGALLCAAAVFFFYRLFLVLLRHDALVPQPEGRGKAKSREPAPETPAVFRFAAAAGSLSLAFSRVFWFNAVSVEVYALHLLFLSLVTLLFVRAVRARAEGGAGPRRLWLLFAYVLGLSFANHMMTVLLAPAFLYLYFATHGFGRAAWLKIGSAVPPFLLGLTPYLYLPVRALQKPALNWGDPSTLGGFWRHVSARQYRFKMFTSTETMRDKLADFFGHLFSDFGYAPPLLAVIGLWALWRGGAARGRLLLVFSTLVFLVSLAYAVNYDFNDPNFWLNAHVAIALWIAVGIAFVGTKAGTKAGPKIAGACLALAVFPLATNHAAVDGSRNFALDDHARNVFAFVKPGGLILHDDFNTFLSPALYLQAVEGHRPDVTVLNTFQLAGAGDRHPGVRALSTPEVRALLRRQGLSIAAGGNPAVAGRILMFRAIVAGNMAHRPVYVTGDMNLEDFRYLDGFLAVPDGLLLRIYPDSAALAAAAPALPDFSFRPLPPRARSSSDFRESYAIGYVNHALQHAVVLRDTATGVALLDKALRVYPGYPHAVRLRGALRRGY